MEALEKANLDPIREQLGAPSGTGRPPLDRDPMMKLYLISRCRRTEVPREMTPLLEWLDTDRHSLTTLCGFDQVPSRSTLRTVFLELDGLKNEVRIAQAQVIRLLKEKDGDGLSYQAARRWVMGCCFCNPCAARAVQEKSPSRTGVVRAMARSDHWRWVSRPRWVRTSRKVTSSCQRRTNHSRIWVGSADGSVHSKAWVAKEPLGSRISTQRMRTGGLPERYQTAVWEVSSTVRVAPSYQATATLAQVTRGLVKECRNLKVTPHVAQKQRSAINRRTTRHDGHRVNQRARKRIEEVFGWVKTVAGGRKLRYCGIARNRLWAEMTMLESSPIDPSPSSIKPPIINGSPQRVIL